MTDHNARQAGLIERLQNAYDKVKVYPEDRMTADAVLSLGEGFMDLLELRNLVPEAIPILAAHSADARNAVLHTEDDGEIGDSVESIVACLGDDAAMIRDEHPEVAANMDKAAEVLEALAREVKK